MPRTVCLSYPRFLDEVVGDEFEEVCIEAFTIVEWPLYGAAHPRCQPLHFNSDALTIHGALISVPEEITIE